jgi:hypothetical protein
MYVSCVRGRCVRCVASACPRACYWLRVYRTHTRHITQRTGRALQLTLDPPPCGVCGSESQKYAQRSAGRSPPPALAHLRLLMAARPQIAGVGSSGGFLEGAGQWSPQSGSEEAVHSDGFGAKRQRTSDEAVGVSTTDAAGHGQHVRDEPTSGADAPSSNSQRLSLATQPLT